MTSAHFTGWTISFLTAALCAIGGTCAARATPPSAVFVSHGDIDTAFAALSPKFTDDEPVRVVDAGVYNVGVFAVGRPKIVAASAAAADGSERVTEGLQLDNIGAIVRILKGSGTFVAGGALADGQRIAKDDPDLPVIGPGLRGKLIKGGEARHVSAGDMIIVPAGVAHGFSAIEQPLTYMVIRIDGQKVLPLK